MNAATLLYQKTAITTQDRRSLIALLYDGAIRFLKQARASMVDRDYPKKNYFLLKAREIIFELNSSLDMENGGDIAKNLRSIYTFLWTRMGRVNRKNDIELLDRLIGILEQIAPAWKQIVQN